MTQTPPPPQEAAFFSAIRGWNIQRGDRLLGGVASGLGARVGMAPVPARLLMVLAGILLNGLVLLAYAAAWGLLPDRRGSIVIQDFGRGVTNVGALIGIAVTGILGFVTLDNGGLFGGIFGTDPFPWDNMGDFGPMHIVAAFFAIVIPLALLGGLVFLVIYLVRRGNRGSVPPGTPGATTWSSADAPAPSAASAADAMAESRTDVADPDSPDEPASPSEHAAAADASATPTATSPVQPQPWEPALLPGDPRVNTPRDRTWRHSPAVGGPVPNGSSAYAWNARTGEQAYVPPVAYAPPRPKPPRVPGPGKAAWLAFAGVAVLAVAAVFAIDRADRLVIDPVLAWGVGLTIGLGVIVVAVAVSGRRLGFLGFLSVCAVLVSLPLVANADELHDYYRDNHDWWDTSGPVVESSASAEATAPDFGPVSIAEAFGDSYSSVYLSGSCYEEATGEDAWGEADSLLQLDSLDADREVTLRGWTTDVSIPSGISLAIDGVTAATVEFVDRGVWCDVWSDGSVDDPAVEFINVDTPVLTLHATDGSTIIIHEEDSL